MNGQMAADGSERGPPGCSNEQRLVEQNAVGP